MPLSPSPPLSTLRSFPLPFFTAPQPPATLSPPHTLPPALSTLSSFQLPLFPPSRPPPPSSPPPPPPPHLRYPRSCSRASSPRLRSPRLRSPSRPMMAGTNITRRRHHKLCIIFLGDATPPRPSPRSPLRLPPRPPSPRSPPQSSPPAPPSIKEGWPSHHLSGRCPAPNGNRSTRRRRAVAPTPGVSSICDRSRRVRSSSTLLVNTSHTSLRRVRHHELCVNLGANDAASSSCGNNIGAAIDGQASRRYHQAASTEGGWWRRWK